MPPLSRREYLRYSGALTAGSVTASGTAASRSDGDGAIGAGPAAVPAPTGLRTEYTSEPNNLQPAVDPVASERAGEPFEPRLQWRVATDERGSRQSAYRVLVASEPEMLAGDAGDVWDSGRVDSPRSNAVRLEADAQLEPEETYYWKARVWDQDGNASPWSEPAKFTTAVDQDTLEEWDGTWIGSTRSQAGGAEQNQATEARVEESPLLRKEFDLEKEIERARLHVVTLGYGEVYLNGERIGDHELDSPQTQYRRRALFSTYDVTEALQSGANALGLWLGRGWFSKDRWWLEHIAWSTPASTLEGEADVEVNHYGGVDYGGYGPPTALLQLHVEYADGSSDSVATDTSWQTHPSPIVENDIYEGETYNALLEQPGWAEPGFDDTAWTPAVEHPFAEGLILDASPEGLSVNPGVPQNAASLADPAIRPQRTPPIEVTETLEPEEIHTVGGDYVIDFGQEFPGWLELRITGASEGDRITLQHAERVYEDGDIDRRSNRKASNEDVYVAKGDDEEVYEPRFTYHAFRYAKIQGYPGDLTSEDVTGKVVHTGFEQTGSFACSNEDLTRIQQNAVWGLRSNRHSIPTDCPQRDERFGWTGDASLSARTDLFNFDADVVRFHEKWQRDHTDSQHDNGSLQDVVPSEPREGSSDTNWTRTRVVIPWYIYLHTGDDRVLREHYESMTAYAEYWHGQADGHIVTASLGDWGSPEGRQDQSGLIGTFGYYHLTETLAKIATVLGEDEDAATYSQRTEAIAEAFNDAFFDPETATYGNGLQKSYALPLFLDIVPREHHDAVVENFVGKIEADGNVLQTGFVSTGPLLFSLADNGHEELAYHIASQPEQPGWVFMLRNDATTVWEHWDILDRYEEPASDMLSHNHPNYTLISEWFYRRLAGINVGEPGFEHVVFDPMVVDDLEWAEADTETPHGEVASRWAKTDAGLEMDVAVPWNSTATVRVPDLDAGAVRLREGDRPVWNEGGAAGSLPDGVESITRTDDAVVVEIGSGEYSFELERHGG